MYDFDDIVIEAGLEIGYRSKETGEQIREPGILVRFGDVYDEDDFDCHDELMLTLAQAEQLIARIQAAIEETK